MKNEEKKKKRVVDWKSMGGFAVGFMLVMIVGVMFHLWAGERDRVNDELERINWNAGMALHGGQADEIYQEIHVSDDGKWFLVPEVRVKFPFFWAESTHVNDIGSKSGYRGPGPLRYKPFAWWHDYDGDEGFQVDFTFSTFSERWGTACVDPFRVAAYDSDRTSLRNGDEYETITELDLADGRMVKLMQRSGLGECMEFIDSNMGQTMAAKLKEAESY